MVCLLLIVLVKSYNENRFITLLPLFVSNRYLKIYGKEQSHKIDWFNLLLFVVQILIVTLIASFTLKTYNYILDDNYITISSIFTAFIIFKYFLEKIIASIFEIEKFASKFIFDRASYRNLIAILIFPLIIILIFSDLDKKIIITIIFILFLVLNFMSLTLTIKKHQKAIRQWLFYFILYLCAFEMVPYLIALKLLL